MLETTQMKISEAAKEKIRSLLDDLRNMGDPECGFHPGGPCWKCMAYREKQDEICEVARGAEIYYTDSDDEDYGDDAYHRERADAYYREQEDAYYREKEEAYRKEMEDCMDISQSSSEFLLDDEDELENNNPRVGPSQEERPEQQDQHPA